MTVSGTATTVRRAWSAASRSPWTAARPGTGSHGTRKLELHVDAGRRSGQVTSSAAARSTTAGTADGSADGRARGQVRPAAGGSPVSASTRADNTGRPWHRPPGRAARRGDLRRESALAGVAGCRSSRRRSRGVLTRRGASPQAATSRRCRIDLRLRRGGTGHWRRNYGASALPTAPATPGASSLRLTRRRTAPSCVRGRLAVVAVAMTPDDAAWQPGARPATSSDRWPHGGDDLTTNVRSRSCSRSTRQALAAVAGHGRRRPTLVVPAGPPRRRRGAGRSDPRDQRSAEPVRPLLRRDPDARGPQRVRRAPTSVTSPPRRSAATTS